jgi:hypothetical protein
MLHEQLQGISNHGRLSKLILAGELRKHRPLDTSMDFRCRKA